MANVSNYKHNPSAFFKAPSNVLESVELSKDDKISILKQWAYDEREKEVAEEENMAGSVNGGSRLHDILEALLTLQTETDLPKPPPTKHA